MKKRKILSAALAAALAFGSLSAVSYAEDAEIREESGYSITLENTTVEGKEMAAVIFEGLPKEIFSIDVTQDNGEPHFDEIPLEKINGKSVIWVADFTDGALDVRIDWGDGVYLRCFTNTNRNINTEHNWEAWSVGEDREDYRVVSTENGDTVTLTTYFDLDNAKVRALAAKDTVVVSVRAEVIGSGSSHYDFDDNGHIDENDKKSIIAIGDSTEYIPIYSNSTETLKLHAAEGFATAKERVQITNNLTGIDPLVEKVFSDTEIEVNEGIDDAVKTALSGITVTDSFGAFDEDVVMNVKGTAQTESSFSFDITFTKNGEEVQPRKKVFVKVPLPEFLKGKTIRVTHYDPSGNATTVPSRVEGNFVIFDATHFSVYTLSFQKQQSSGSSSSSSTNASSSESTAPKTTNPDTGVSLAGAPAILAAGAAVVVLANRKRR